MTRGRGGVSRHTPKITTSFNVHAPYSTKFHQFLKKSSMQNEYKKRVCLFLVVFFSAFFSFLFSAPYSLLISPFSFILHNLTKSAIFKVWFFWQFLWTKSHWMPSIWKRMQNLSYMKDHTYASHEYRSDNGWNWQHYLIHCFAIAQQMCEKLTAKGWFARKSRKVAC